MDLIELSSKESELVEKILKNCENLALCGKYNEIKDRGHSTRGVWNYEDNEIKIRYEFGINYYGDGERYEIIYNNSKVLETEACEQRISKKMKDGCFLTQYIPGEWENIISEKLKNSKKKKK